METNSTEERKELLLNKIKGGRVISEQNLNGKDINDPLNQKVKKQKLYMPVKIESDIVKMFKRIVYENDLESHGIIMNTVLRNWANEILGNS